MKTIKELMGLEEAEKMKGEDPCWDTHQMVGMKMKNGKKVPNCVPKAKAKNEETELEEASETKRPPNFTMHPIDRQDYKILRKSKKTPPKDSKEWGRDGGEKKIKEETEQIDEISSELKQKYLSAATKKHLQQFLGRASVRDKQELDKRRAAIQKTSKELTGKTHYQEEVEMDEGMLDAVKSAAKGVAKRVADSAKSTAVGFVHGAIDSATSHSPILRHAGKKLHKVVKKKLGEETEQIDEISAEVKQKYLAAATKKHLQQFLGRAPVRDKQELDKRRAAIQKTSKELTGKTHYQEEVEVEESKKIPASEKPVDPKDLVVSLKDVPVKNPRGSGKYKPEQDFPGVKALKREEIELEEIEVEMTHQERAYKRSLDLKTTVLEAVKSMKKKEVTKDVDVKKGEKLSGKQEPVKMNPALYEK